MANYNRAMHIVSTITSISGRRWIISASCSADDIELNDEEDHLDNFRDLPTPKDALEVKSSPAL